MKIVVIGSGVVGASATYELARAGVDVALVDSTEEGRATSAGAGIICPWSSRVADPDWFTVASRGAEYYPGLRARLIQDGISDFGYRQVGSLKLTTEHAADAEFAATTQRAASSEIAGNVEVITAEQARELFPPLSHAGPVIHIPGAARLDGRQLRTALRTAAGRHGATFVDGRAQLRVDGNGQVIGVTVGDAVLSADAVIAATGAWEASLLAPLGITSGIRPQRGQIIHLRMDGSDTSAWSVVLPMSSHYLLAFDDSRIVVGATREENSGFDYRLTAAGVHAVLQEALSCAPGLGNATYLEARIGFRPVGPDSLPLLGAVTAAPGLIIANGLGPTGLTMGPYVGSVAARLARGDDPGLDLAPYDPVRSR